MLTLILFISKQERVYFVFFQTKKSIVVTKKNEIQKVFSPNRFVCPLSRISHICYCPIYSAKWLFLHIIMMAKSTDLCCSWALLLLFYVCMQWKMCRGIIFSEGAEYLSFSHSTIEIKKPWRMMSHLTRQQRTYE